MSFSVPKNREVYTLETSCMKRTFVQITNMCKNKTSSVIVSFEILLRIPGCDPREISPSRNMPRKKNLRHGDQ